MNGRPVSKIRKTQSLTSLTLKKRDIEPLPPGYQLISPSLKEHPRLENEPDYEILLQLDNDGRVVEQAVKGSTDIDYAERMSEQIGPRVVKLTDQTFIPDPRFPAWSNKRSVIGIGCQGDGDHQYGVADFMNKFVKDNPELNIRYVIGLGDNFYDSGIPSPFSPQFNDKFYTPYFGEDKKALRDLAFIMCLGNHCYNYHLVEEAKTYVRPILQPIKKAAKALNKKVDTTVPPKGKKAARNQTIHSLFFHAIDPKTELEKYDLYRQPSMDVKELSKFDMSYYHTSKIDGQFQYFFVDSNTILADTWEYYNWLASDQKKPLNKNNQAAFLIREYWECIKAGRIPVLVDHHPWISLNKRAFKYDSALYNKEDIYRRLDLIYQLPKDEMYLPRLRQIIKCTTENLYKIPGIPYPTVDYKNYNTMLLRNFASQGMRFPLHMCAHDHMLAYVYTKGLPDVSMNFDPKTGTIFKTPNRPDDLSEYAVCQLTTGGGGGPIHARKWFDLGEGVGCVGERNGFAILTMSPDKPTIEIHILMYKEHRIPTINKEGKEDFKIERHLDSHLRFESGSSEPIIEYGPPPAGIRHPESYITPLEQIREKERLIKEGKIKLTPDEIKFREFRKLIIQACRTYQDFLHKKMVASEGNFLDVTGNTTHYQSDVTVMHNMMNYLNHHKARPFDEAVVAIYKESRNFVNGGEKMNVKHFVTSIFRGTQPEGSESSLILEINRLLRASDLLGNKNLTELVESLNNPNDLTFKK